MTYDPFATEEEGEGRRSNTWQPEHAPALDPYDPFFTERPTRGSSAKLRSARVTLPLSDEDASAAVEMADIERAFVNMLKPHVDHPWHKIGRCVYCGPCGKRLYQGEMPADHEVFVRERRLNASAADRMRARWGMDDGTRR